MASANISRDIVEFDGIKYSRTDAIFEGEHGQRIYRGSCKQGTGEREAAIIVFEKCGNVNGVSPDAQQTYINKNYERVISREQHASFVRDGLACENLHRYYVETIDQQSETMYVAAEPFVCTLANLLDSEKLSKNCVSEDKTTKQKTFTDKKGRFKIVHTEKDISYFWNEQGNYNFTISRKEIIRQIVRGLAFLHGYRIIHRNVTPESIFVTYDKNTKQVLIKLSGFCLSKKARGDMSTSNSGSRTVGWSPREMVLNPQLERITASVDIFSLGCVMYYVLTSGDHPFKESERNILRDKYAPQPPERMKFSNEWFLIKRMISHNSEERPSIKEVRESPALLDKDHYVIYHTENKPVCLIFNQENFPGSENSKRVGSSDDAKNLAETFRLFGFECFVRKDLAAEEIRRRIIKFSKTSGYQCIVVCVLSHGDEEGIDGADSQTLTYKELREIFADWSHNKDGNCFNGQPKIFIYQSCRGNQTQLSEEDSVPISDGNLQNASAMEVATADGGFWSKPNSNRTPNRDPALSDFLEVFSTIHGFEAWRNPEGSPFISTLCKRLQEKGDSEDFGSIVQLNDELQSCVVALEDVNERRIKKIKCKQVSIKEGYGLSKCLRLEKVDPAEQPDIDYCKKSKMNP